VGLQADRVLRHLLLPEQHGGELRLRPIETPTRLAQLPPPPLRAPGRARPRLPLGHPGAALGGAGRRARASATGRPGRTWRGEGRGDLLSAPGGIAPARVPVPPTPCP